MTPFRYMKLSLNHSESNIFNSKFGLQNVKYIQFQIPTKISSCESTRSFKCWKVISKNKNKRKKISGE